MPRVVHFEIPADDPKRASSFYKNVFDWKIDKWDGPVDYWMVITGEKDTPGINGGIMQRPDQGGTICNTIEVDSVDTFLSKVTENGGAVAVPKTAIPTVGWIAYCMDTEKNIFGIMEMDENAK